MNEQTFLIMAILVVVALLFDFMNGFHDAANSIALMVSTRLLTPQAAVIWAAFFNFIAFLIFGLHVAKTVGSGIVSPAIIDNAVIFGALCGAISWNIVTWWFGQSTFQTQARYAEGAVLVVQLNVDPVIARFGNTPRHAA